MNLEASSNRSNMVSSRRKRRSTFGIYDRIAHLRDYRHRSENVESRRCIILADHMTVVGASDSADNQPLQEGNIDIDARNNKPRGRVASLASTRRRGDRFSTMFSCVAAEV